MAEITLEPRRHTHVFTIDKYMQIFKRTLVWLSRINHCRGFGIQSPWAYRMVSYVINEHWPYYAYDDLRRRHPSVKAIERKLCELCLRLSNHVQPCVMVNVDDEGNVSGDYLKAGCRKARYVETGSRTGGDSFRQIMEGIKGTWLIRVTPHGNFVEMFSMAYEHACDGSVIMLTGIRTDKAARRLWDKTVKELPRTVTFDLYYCGLVFFDDKLYKQNYIINF